MSGDELSAGSELLGYRVEGLLGRGGMGVVHLAEDLRLRRRVALKLLAPPLAQDGGFRERFLAESKLAASLDHPCVVPIYEAGEGDGRLFIAMRYVAGCDLKALLRDGPLSAERTVGVCAQVADALDFAHGRGLVHRDVKPSNVLLDARDHAYLADFGLTKRLGESHAVEPGLLGTIDYVAPEQIRGEKIDGRADEYSLGCLLYECLTGAPPFARSTDAAVLFAHLEERPPAPQGLEAVMETALAKEPEDRYPTCVDLIVAASEALGVGARARLPGLPFALAGVMCPFKGLAFFDRADAEYFCGRERVVSEVVARLAASTLVGILGPSGIGKSSLLRAGVLTALGAGVLPGSALWRQVVLRPGAHPCRELTRVFGSDGIDAALAGLEDSERIVVVIDQLEELFTACQFEHERAAFLEHLAAAARDRDRRALVLCSLRADFYGRFGSYPGFAQLLSSSHVLVGPMDRAELARAIEEPASRAGLEVEQPLVEALVSDVAGEPGGLPLLSTMLLELWQARDERTLRYESYRTSGGVRGAIARLAERAFVALDESEQAVARNVMLRLVRGEEAALVRRRVPLSELEQIDGAERVVAKLTDARLVTVSDGEIEVSHEALLEEWPRYRGWLDEDRVGRRLHAHLTTTAHEWHARGRDPGDLYRGARLAGAQDWALQHGDLTNALEDDFLQASDREARDEARQQRARNRRLRSLLLGVGMLLVIAVLAGIIALVQKQNAKNQARIALAGELGAEAVNEPRIDLALLLAREAVNLDRSPQTEGALFATLLRNPAVIGTFELPPDSAPDLTVTPDGRTLAASDADLVGGVFTGRVRFYDTRTHAVQRPPLSDFAGYPPPVYSSDGSLLVYVADDHGVIVLVARDSHTLALLTKFPLGEDFPVGSVLIAPDRRSVYYPYFANPTGVYLGRWSLQSGRLLSTARIGPSALFASRLVDAGARVLVVTAAGIDLFDAYSLHMVRSMAITPKLSAPAIGPGGQAAAISPDGHTVVIGSQSGSVLFVDASTGRVRRGIGGHGAAVGSVVYLSNGRTVVTVGDDGRTIIWDPKTAMPSAVLAGPPGQILDAAITSDGATLYTSALGGVLLQWDLTGTRRFGHRSVLGVRTQCCGPLSPPIPPLAVSPDGSKFAARIGPSTVGVFSAQTLQREATFTIRPTNVVITALAWSPTAPEVAVAGYSGVVQLWSVASAPRLMRSLVGLQPLSGLREAVQTIAFSPNGKLLAASDETVSVTGYGEPVQSLAIWGAISGRLIAPVREIPLTNQGLTSVAGYDVVAFSPSGKLLAVSLLDGRMLVLDASAGHIRRTLRPAGGETSLAFAPNGMLVTGTPMGTLERWNPNSGDRIATPPLAASSPVTGIAFDPTDHRFATTGYRDGTIKLWSTSTLQEEGTALTTDTGATSTAAFVPGGRSLLAIDDHGNSFSWPTSLAAWDQHACAVAGRSLTLQEWKRFVSGRRYTEVCP